MLDSRPFLSHQLMGQEARANNVHFYTGENVQINIDINMYLQYGIMSAVRIA